MTYKTKGIIDISVSLALISCILLSMCGFAASCEDMYSNIFRVRIIANSNSDADQALKISVRDRLLESSKTLFADMISYDDAVFCANENIGFLKKMAEEEVLSNGFDYSVAAEIRDEFFDTRKYDGFTLPAGTYKTLVVTLGEGKGENWWCVMYPKVCVGACAGELTETIEETSAEYAENSEKYILKFKVVEIFQKFKKIL